jgi:hypothetical protein
MSFKTPIRTEPFISANAGTQLAAKANAAIWMARNIVVPPWAVVRRLKPGLHKWSLLTVIVVNAA